MNVTLTPDIRQRLDAHLDAVEQTLAASGRSREQRRGIVDDLEAQIQDMLAAKTQSPALADLEAVLAQLDPPSAYGEGAPRAAGAAPVATATNPSQIPGATVPPRRPRYSRAAIWGLVCIMLSLLPLPMMAIGAFFFASRAAHVVTVQAAPPAGPEGPVFMPVAEPGSLLKGVGLLGSCMFVVMGPLALAGTVLGWVAFGQIRSSAGRLRGMGLALFDGLFYPLFFLIFSVITPFFLPIVGIALLLACIAVIYIIIRAASGQRVFS